MAITHGDLPSDVAHRGGHTLDVIAMVLMIVGGLNWGLVGLFNFDLVAALFGDGTLLSRIVYTLVGLAALYGIATLTRLTRRHA
ncbi:DUF378 domain-containing protein [Azohydromonas caseinilytica]|uniref:DUF378 domain-containing protein n=1 Tax=Azohydromonas caseinilytica TaxID=2728836 RepID=A0A848FEV9_9BURK|nr:DUF378 domain-containing protein [Azohydromonas caseinilytica]NML16803.1 DUF378 domain-containing protein [Azohydromonas caseinilytica]